MYTVAQTEQTQSWLKRRPVRFVVATTNTAERTGQGERRDIQVAVCHFTTRCHRVPHTGPVVDSGCLRDRGEKHKGHQLYVVGRQHAESRDQKVLDHILSTGRASVHEP